MLRKVEFENFMSLKNVSVSLQPLTVFIGPNASGKSAIFKALVTFSRLMNRAPVRGPQGEFALESGVTLDDIVWGGNSGLPIRFRAWFDDEAEEPGYSLELMKRAEGWSVTREKIRTSGGWIEVDESKPFIHSTERVGRKEHRPPLRGTLRYVVHPFVNDSAARPTIEPLLQFAERFGMTWRYRPSASDIAEFVRRPTGPEARTYVRENGWGLAAELQALQGSKREVFERIEKAVCSLFPHIKSIGFKTDWQGVRLSFMTNRSEDLMPAPQESDGVLIATFLYWRLYTAGPSLRVCLEEPENGLYPFLLGDRLQLLKNFASGEQGQEPVQILIATHSRDLLRTVKTHPASLVNEIRVVDFAPGSGTSVSGLSSYREAHSLFEKYGNVGDLWQSGEVGGALR